MNTKNDGKQLHLARRIGALVAGFSLALLSGLTMAWEVPPDDFLTGGGWIQRITGAKANFGVGGGVKNGAWWGHLNYIDHGDGLHVHATSVTAYYYIDERTRDICGRADTDRYGPVDYHVRATDNGEPGRDDIFILRLGQSGTVVYTTEFDPDHTLSGAEPGGGNIQLHKGNRSNVGPGTPPECNI
jgi:hypothetical protein